MKKTKTPVDPVCRGAEQRRRMALGGGGNWGREWDGGFPALSKPREDSQGASGKLLPGAQHQERAVEETRSTTHIISMGGSVQNVFWKILGSFPGIARVKMLRSTRRLSLRENFSEPMALWDSIHKNAASLKICRSMSVASGNSTYNRGLKGANTAPACRGGWG